jgi:hypothetical protein
VVSELGPIDPNTDVSTVRQEPYNMPAGFEWSDIDVNDPAQLTELYNLLTENYVEDDDCQFRFDYSTEFLKWALTPPGFMPQLHIGVRSSKSKALMGCITGIPSDIAVYQQTIPMVEINFLCVHKKLRYGDLGSLNCCCFPDAWQILHLQNKETCARVDQGGHETRKSHRSMAGDVHCWSRLA